MAILFTRAGKWTENVRKMTNLTFLCSDLELFLQSTELQMLCKVLYLDLLCFPCLFACIQQLTVNTPPPLTHAHCRDNPEEYKSRFSAVRINFQEINLENLHYVLPLV